MPPVTLRRWSNFGAGIFISFGVLALAVGLDMLMLRAPDPDYPRHTVAAALMEYGLWMIAISVLALSLLTRPRVEAAHDRLVVRNVLTDTVVPRAAYVGLVSGAAGWLKIRTSTGNLYAWGLEEQKFAGPPVERALLPVSFLDGDPAGSSAQIRRRLRRPEWYEVLLWLSWAAYVLASLATGGPAA
ncbi:hypothetical protein [Aquipuribacter hungaricus]|uniref:PH (Pleckstrin Homology) domain-containing protein n=1 Tax=Aquipuribacter hungaricus TaxID=545624 RepID=A0ABV7WAX2_9MICO